MRRSPVTVMFILFVYSLFNDTDGSSIYEIVRHRLIGASWTGKNVRRRDDGLIRDTVLIFSSRS
jgi:hypothetical protein